MRTWRPLPGGPTLCGVFWAALLTGVAWAAPAEEPSQFTTNSLDREACSNQLRRISGALRAYRRENGGELPAWLSDLEGQYLKQEVLTCPFARSSLRVPDWRKGFRDEVFRDPNPYTSYSYEFSTVEYPDWKEVYGFSVTVRQWKEHQRRLVRDQLPIVRCFAHRPVLNLSIGGSIFESDTEWENLFTNVVAGSPVGLSRLATFAPDIREHLRQGLPARDPGTSPRLLDLSAQFVAPLTVTWLPDARSNHLAGLPRGRQPLDGLEWDLRGVVQLNPSRAPFYFSDDVPGIVVRQKCRAIHFLHATDGPLAPGTRVGGYVVHFSDGTKQDIPLRYGENIGEWWCEPDSPPAVSTCRVAWEGSNPAAAAVNRVLRLYHARWDNPTPDLEIATLDFVSALAKSAPFLIAITLE